MTKLYFVRHGQTDLNLQMRCQGRLDYPLNETGMKQLEETARTFKDIKIDKIYSSPLKRARQSAEIIAKSKNLDIHILDESVEIDHGELEGMNFSDAKDRYPSMLTDWVEHPNMVGFPGGESLEDVRKRMIEGVGKIFRADDGKSVLLLTHQVFACVARCHFGGRPLSEIWNDKLQPGEFFVLDIDEDGDSRTLRGVLSREQAEKVPAAASLGPQ